MPPHCTGVSPGSRRGSSDNDIAGSWTILRRLVLGLPALLGVIIVSFALTRLLPGDPAVYFAGAAPTPEAIADLRKTCCWIVRSRINLRRMWATSRMATLVALW